MLGLSGCNGVTKDGAAGNDIYGALSNVDLSARESRDSSQASGLRQTPQGISYVGTDGAQSDASSPASQNAGGYEIDFDKVPVASVGKSIIVDTLGLGLSIDPRVTGEITLSSGRPLKSNELLSAFETALKANNAALLKDPNGYRIVPMSETSVTGNVDHSGEVEPGFGLSVMPLKYISAENILKLVEGFSIKAGSVRVDSSRNLLIIQGSGDERRAVVDTVNAFDHDFMRGQSVGIYPVVNAPPETIITELQRIMHADDNGTAKGVVQFQPVLRMNAVLVVAQRAETLRTAAKWIQRLDSAENSASLSKVYRVKYGNARQLAVILNQTLGGQNSTANEGDSDALQPGAGRVSLNAPTSNTGSSARSNAAPLANGSFSSPFGNVGTTSSFQQRSGTDTTTNAPTGGGGGGRADGKVQISADASTNSLVIVADRERMRMIEQVLSQLDRPRLQVAIEATIAEVSLNESLQYGVQYYLKSRSLPGAPLDKGSLGLSSTDTAVIGRVLPGFNFLLGPSTDPHLILDALNTKTDVKVLSSPSVVVLDNNVALIQVGDQVPVATSQSTLVGVTNTGSNINTAFPTQNSIDYRNTGVILRVLPRVSSNGNVTLEVEQEISNVVNNGSQGTLTPTVSQRHLRSSIAVTSGQTVLLGGLISDRQVGGRDGVPLLSSIAYLGDLFAHNSTARDRTELIIFIRPKIIADGFDAQNVAEEMRNRMLATGANRN